MNCAECRENLLACAENLLEPEQLRKCKAHLEGCANCRSEFSAVRNLQAHLTVRGQMARRAFLIEPVMRRVLQTKPEPKGDTIMSKILKHRWGFGLGVAGAAAMITFLLTLNISAPKAFGIEQVIEAYNHIRFLHVRAFPGGQSVPNEFWIKANEQGRVEKARYFLPVTEDGPKLITWTPEKTEIWFQKKHGYVILQTQKIQPWMQSMLDQGQPQLLLKKLLDAHKTGQVALETQQLNGDTHVVVAVNTNGLKQVISIDAKTDLIKTIEAYHIKGTNEELRGRTEFSDYNVPIDDKMFSIREELPADVRIADRLNQVSGVAQGNMTDEQAATETVRQFFDALAAKDYKKAGLITGGALEETARAEYGQLNIVKIISVGPAEPQPKWNQRGFKVPCELEITTADGHAILWKPAPYVRPGDDEAHPDHWNVTGGATFTQAAITIPDNDTYAKKTPKEAAEGFFKACADKDWSEFVKYWPGPAAGDRMERIKEFLGGLEIVWIGEPFQTNNYPGYYVPYEIKLPPAEFNVRVSNANPAGRYVITGVYDSKLKSRQELNWTNAPAILPDNNVYAGMSPAEAVKNYLEAFSKSNWEEMRKFAPDYDVDSDKAQIEAARKKGFDIQQLPRKEVIEAFWSAEHSAWFVKCRTLRTKKWNLCIRNDNPSGRWQVDGGF